MVMSLNGPDRAISATREFCLNSGAAAHGDYNSLLEIDGNGMPILFLGTTQSWQAGHHKIIRFDSDLNSDYEETVICNNDPTCTNLLDWDDVAFDPLGNMLVYHYTHNCNLYWNGSYMGRTSSNLVIIRVTSSWSRWDTRSTVRPWSRASPQPCGG